MLKVVETIIYPKLSIVVPTYNRSNYLQECLDSIIIQNYPNIEIIVTDDNSTDDTQAVCEEYIKKYPYVIYVKNTKYSKGSNGNKNNGMDYVTGEIMGILDDDDTLVADSLIMMVDKMLEGYDIVMVNCKFISDSVEYSEKFSGFGLENSDDMQYKKYLCGEITGEHWSVFRVSLLNNKRFDADSYGRESNLWLRMLRNAKIYYIHKAIRNYRIHENSVSHNTIINADKLTKSYEIEIEHYGDEMKKECPCYLARIYKAASYFSKLSSQYNKSFFYI